jgi:hypothetical protein
MKNSKGIIGFVIGLAALGATVFVASLAWKRGQKNNTAKK